MKIIKSYIKELRASNYRYYICCGITLLFLACGYLFPNAIPRLGEALRDVCTSFIYYVLELFLPDKNVITPTVILPQAWTWAESPFEDISLFPYEWDEFVHLWKEYWALFIDKENFLSYWTSLGDVLYYMSKFFVVAFPLVLILILKLRSYTNVAPNKRKGKSRALIKWEGFIFKVVYPVVSWCKDFVYFVRVNQYWKIWLALWMLYFNIFSIIVAALAYYLYFIVAFDFISIYNQVLKLLKDLTPMMRFLPGVVWLCLGIYVYNYICRSMAFQRLYAYERANRSFLKKRGVVTTVYGEMGTGKTQLITSMALSSEVEQWDMAFEVMLEMDLMFPNFPWDKLRDYLKREINDRRLCDLDAVRARMETYRKGFDYVIQSGFTPLEWQAHRKTNKVFKRSDYTFGYDFEHYKWLYDDNLKVVHLYDAITDYACAYLIFTAETSLIFANYSIRVDSIIQDLGNMPLRNNDFFARDSRLMEAYSRQCHIINYDMLRLGKRMRESFKLSFGTYVITEVDKERKNTLELKETKRNVEECNQNNDLFNSCLMMCRHAAVVANRVFIRIICDLQRPEAWGAGGRELGEVIYIEEKGQVIPCLPFFSPYWLFQGLFLWIKGKWEAFHSAYIHVRRDGTLFAWLVNNITSAINQHYDRVEGQFGTFVLKLHIQSGRMDGQVVKDKWRIILKKDRSRRYQTDCLTSVFHLYKPNRMHIDDFTSYAGIVGTLKENGLQNSYFQNDISEMHQKAA